MQGFSINRSIESQKKFVQSKPLFSFEKVCVNFRNIKALRSVDLKILEKDILFITGASGAGKTTLLNVLAGFQKPSSGRVILPLHNKPNYFQSCVFQDLRLLTNETCEENLFVAYDPKLFRSRNDFYKELIEMARLLGVYDYLGHRIKDCNGGLKQKIVMMRALLSKPNTLIADEPTAALDRENSYRLFELLSYLNQKKNLTIVWATHNKDLIKQFPGKVAHLEQGKLVYSGNACFI